MELNVFSLPLLYQFIFFLIICLFEFDLIENRVVAYLFLNQVLF